MGSPPGSAQRWSVFQTGFRPVSDPSVMPLNELLVVLGVSVLVSGGLFPVTVIVQAGVRVSECSLGLCH